MSRFSFASILLACCLAATALAEWPHDPMVNVQVCSSTANQWYPQIVADGTGGAILVWEDSRDGVDSYSTFCQKIERNGYLGYPAPIITDAVDHPGDQGGTILLSWLASYLDGYPSYGIDYYSVWRRLGEGRQANADAFPGAAAPVTLDEFGRHGWVYVDNVSPIPFEEYGFHAPSYGDSTAAGNIFTDYIVLAHNTTLDDFWMSEVISGYSIDNLAPGAPLDLLAISDYADVELSWASSGLHDEDLSVYRIYRSDEIGFTPDETNFLAAASDTLYTDTGPGSGTWYYRVTAMDVHENEGEASNEAAAEIATAVGDLPIAALALRGNYPNPFNPATRIAFDLPSAAQVCLTVHDLRGRELTRLVDGELEEGRHELVWRGVDASGKELPSGIYFARLSAEGRTMTRKMVLMK